MRRIRALVLGAVLLLLGGCGSGDAPSDVEVRPFSEVQVSDLVFEADPANPDRAIFRVTTTEPMICAIVWGETPELGQLNNSLTMNGTGIAQHDVFLPGAVPGVEYYFRVQGSGADGTLYSSELARFRIEEPQGGAGGGEQVEHGPNLAVGATVVEVSSEFSEGFAAELALDDQGTTEWSSAGDGDDAFIAIDLGASREIAGVEFITRSMLDGTAITQTYTVTIDGETFGPFEAGTARDPGFAAVAATGRQVRFDVETSTGGNVGAVEVRVLAP
jgi:hypothetical protein